MSRIEAFIEWYIDYIVMGALTIPSECGDWLMQRNVPGSAAFLLLVLSMPLIIAYLLFGGLVGGSLLIIAGTIYSIGDLAFRLVRMLWRMAHRIPWSPKRSK